MHIIKASAIILILIALCGCTAPDAVEPTPGVTYQVMVPLAARCSITQTVIFDCQGNVTDAVWLAERFGSVGWDEGLAEARACCGDCPASFTATVMKDGLPASGATVVWSWPGAPGIAPELRGSCGIDVGIVGVTDADGRVGFAMGPGGYYFRPAGGPHAAWIPGGPCMTGIGMLGGTNHEHVDGVWVLP